MTMVLIVFLLTMFLANIALSKATPGPTEKEAKKFKANWPFEAIGKSQSDNLWNGTGIVVAVIDTGVDFKHPALKKSIWKNKGELGFDAQGRDKSTNQVDDDGNGFVDDFQGWNFVSNSSDISDRHGHGTHVAGIIGAKPTRASQFMGVAPGVQIMALKYFDENINGFQTMENTVRAIEYAIQMGAHVINYSSGGRLPYAREREVIKKAEGKGILFIAAAGNESSNTDHTGYFPADYKFTNIISVTAVGPAHQVLPSSNFGERSVDIAAPGEDIFSTAPNGKYMLMTGTSQATAFVTGVLAQMMERYGTGDYHWLKNRLLDSSVYLDSLYQKTRSRGILNSARALSGHELRFMAFQGLQPELPNFTSDLSAQ